MISIIVSTYQTGLFNNLKNNIKKTIGVPFEIIAIENDGKYGICEVYNVGAKQSQYDILCFVHEDVLFHTENWGQKLISHFESNKGLGVVGLAGSVIKCSGLSSWWLNKIADFEPKRCNIFQHYKYKDRPSTHVYANPENEKISSVVCLDGVFIASVRKVWEEVKFDTSIKGFHAYDLDFSLRASLKYKVAVVFDIELEHFSEGNIGSNWVVENYQIHRKLNNVLPKLLPSIDESVNKHFKDQSWWLVDRSCFILRNAGYSFTYIFNFAYYFYKINYKGTDFIKNISRLLKPTLLMLVKH
jgi:hypothetical protein